MKTFFSKTTEKNSCLMPLIKSFIAAWAFSGNSLSMILDGYPMDVPVLRILYALLQSLDGWGIHSLFALAGFYAVFYMVRDRQKSPWVSGLSAFFAVCTVVGISYEETSSWNCLFLFKLQLALTLFVAAGYYFTYKNLILFACCLYDRKKHLLKTEPTGKAELFLFQTHPFSGPLLFIFLSGLPWLIFFFPGTLHWDAFTQLKMYMGIMEKTNHHPVITTELMGGFIMIGRHLFHSDTIGFFLYTILQFTIQSLTFSYASWLLRKLHTPVLFCRITLFYWSVFPFFPIWGITMAKDTLYYVFMLLFVTALADTLSSRGGEGKWRQTALLLLGAGGITLFRNDGRYVVCITMFSAILISRKYWKRYLSGIAACVLLVFLVEGIYMPCSHIPGGAVGEALSIPLQQTARYLREHYDELTEEEASVLQQGFTADLRTIADVYEPSISDSVKFYFQPHPSAEYLKSYFRIWFRQFLKHPDTYVQAFLNHTYGYFYPDAHDPSYASAHYNAVFDIVGTSGFQTDYISIGFGISNGIFRQILQNYFNVMEKAPLLSMLLSPGMHIYVLLGELIYLLARKHRRAALLLIPGFCVLMICLVSPVNAYLRYIMPVMAMLPVTAAWCHASAQDSPGNRERQPSPSLRG